MKVGQQAAFSLGLSFGIIIHNQHRHSKQRIVLLFEWIPHDWSNQRHRAVFSFPHTAYFFLPSNLSNPCLAYGSHRLACLNYVGRYCVGKRGKKGRDVYSTYPWHPATMLFLHKEGRWWWKVSVSTVRLAYLLFKQQQESGREWKKV